MTTKKTILDRLNKAVKGTEKDLYTEDELDQFATFYLDKWDEDTSEDVIAESFCEYWWNSSKECRRCSVCGRLMRDGYCEDSGYMYFCSDECLATRYSKEEWERECENNDQSYWTEWY